MATTMNSHLDIDVMAELLQHSGLQSFRIRCCVV